MRDLEREGAIPPAARAENGYRRFTDCHLHALLAYQALSQALRPLGAKRLMRLALTSPRRDVVAGIDEAHGHLHAERQALLRARSAALAITAEEIDTPLPSDSMTISELAGALGIRPSTLRHWESEGLLHPGRTPGVAARSYFPEDVRDARIVDQLRRAGYRIPQLRPLMSEIRQFGSHAEIAQALDTRARRLDARSWALLDAGAALVDLLRARQ